MDLRKYVKELPLSQKAFYIIMAVFGCIFYTIVIANHYYFRTYAFDYANYNFAFWDYAHFHISNVPGYGVMGMKRNFLQDHFSLTLMYFAPLYWLLNWLTGSYTLLIILVTLILWSAWAIYKLIMLKTGDEWLSALAVLYYFLLDGMYKSFALDINILTIVCCLIPLFLFYFESKKYIIAGIILILCLFSREDIPLWFIFIFVVLITWHWKEKKVVRYCVGGIIISIMCFILVFEVLIPAIDSGQAQYNLFQYSALGQTPWQALVHCFKHPIDTFKLLYQNQSSDHAFDRVKIEFYMVYLISGGFLLFIRPQYIIWFIPVLAQKMFNDIYSRWGIYGYYAFQVVILLPVSIFLIISVLKIKWLRYVLALVVCTLTFCVTYYKINSNNCALAWSNHSDKENIFAPQFFHSDYNVAKIHSDLKLIPPNARVSASESLLPHLSQRMYAYGFPDVEDAEYIAIFTFRNFFLTTDSNYARVVHNYSNSPSWKIIANDPPFLLLKKITETPPNKVMR